MALNPINPAESDAVLTEAFFYIKGSTDYPDNQLISKPFGYDRGDVTQEHPIFNTTIADLYKKLHKPCEFGTYVSSGGYTYSSDVSEIEQHPNKEKGLFIFVDIYIRKKS